jgi:hypothetical protein
MSGPCMRMIPTILTVLLASIYLGAAACGRGDEKAPVRSEAAIGTVRPPPSAEATVTAFPAATPGKLPTTTVAGRSRIAYVAPTATSE